MMNTTIMKTRLLEKFSPSSISQSIYLETRRTTDIDELSPKELEKVYDLFFPKQPSLAEQVIKAKNNDILKIHRSNILTIATRIGFKKTDSWDEFNRWMLYSSTFKKKLNDHDLNELKQLERQLRAAESNYNISASKAGNKAWYHKNNLPIPSQS